MTEHDVPLWWFFVAPFYRIWLFLSGWIYYWAETVTFRWKFRGDATSIVLTPEFYDIVKDWKERDR